MTEMPLRSIATRRASSMPGMSGRFQRAAAKVIRRFEPCISWEQVQQLVESLVREEAKVAEDGFLSVDSA
ncbi:hypothetical protein PQR66_30290 [Paraburkholderia agricolaris]|uniref:Uncharacterized protein n=1 Tax=Paraburkholderia agricolaris TaxID=2152888 RepID=A0ABW8ZZ22_9BURK